MAEHTELINTLKHARRLVAQDRLHEIDPADLEGIVRDAIELLESSDIFPKTKFLSGQPDPAVGQVWKNRRSGRYMRIVEIIPMHFGTSVKWKSLHTSGRQEGACAVSTIRENYDFIEEGDTDE